MSPSIASGEKPPDESREKEGWRSSARRAAPAAALVATAIGIGAVVWLLLAFPHEAFLGRTLPWLLLGGVAVLILAVLRPPESQAFNRFAAGFGGSAPWIPFVATIATLGAVLALPESRRLVVVGAGLAFGAIGWAVLALGFAYRNHPAKVNSRVWAEVTERYRTIRTQVDALPAQDRTSAAFMEAEAHLRWLERCVGIAGCATVDSAPGSVSLSSSTSANWAASFRFVDIWTALHRAEEALLELQSKDVITAEIVRDQLRLSGSGLRRLSTRLAALADQIPSLVTDASKVVPPPDWSEVARRLREMRFALNEFRDSRIDGLIRAQNRLTRTTMMTGFTAYLLFILSLVLGAPAAAVAGAAIFFLVGALIGLFAQLRSDALLDEAVEDYGLSAARLRQTAVASGIAAIGGVMLMAITVDTATTGTEIELRNIYNVATSPGQLLIAAVFGLTPQLLIDRLTAKAEEYRKDLTATEAGSSDTDTTQQ